MESQVVEPMGMEDIAAMAGVLVPAVTQWRKKPGSDFPAPLAGYETLAFEKAEVERWLKQKNKAFKPLNLEATLWAAADKMRGHMDAAEYKHVVLGLVFLKYISDAFEDRHRELLELERVRGPTPRTPTSTGPSISFGFHWVPGGRNFRRQPSSRRSGHSSMLRWKQSSVRTPRSRGYCPRTTRVRCSISGGWGS